MSENTAEDFPTVNVDNTGLRTHALGLATHLQHSNVSEYLDDADAIVAYILNGDKPESEDTVEPTSNQSL